MNLKARRLLIATAAIILSACSTPYQEMGLLGGVNATPIDANTVRISSRGNGFTDIGRMKDYVLLRAAEETLNRGYEVFLVVDAENVTHTNTYSIPQFHTAPVMGTAVLPNGGLVTTFGSVNYTTTEVESVTKPGEDIIIKMFKGPKPDNSPANLYSASEIVAYLGPHVSGFDPSNLPAVPAAASTISSSAQEIANTAVASGQKDGAQIRVCTADDLKVAQLAKASEFQYTPTCR